MAERGLAGLLITGLLRPLLIASLLAGAAAAPARADGPAFLPTIQRLFARNCIACHNSVDLQGNLDLQPDHAYANLVNRPSHESKLALVTPGQPEASYLFRKLSGTQVEAGGEGAQMPANGAPLPAAQVEAIRQWIEAGARKGP
jgi:mono/diheme cytochrome c family protein